MTDPRPSSLESLIQEHAPFLERLARALVGDVHHARDLVQETWAVALADPAALRMLQDQGAGPTRGWLATVLRRRSHSRLRRAGIRKTESIPVEQASGDQLPDATATRWERQRLVQEALHRLPEPYRTTIILRFQDELSPQEIADRTGTPASTVRTQVARGLELLRELLDREHPGGRVEWLSALLPLGWPGMALPVPTTGTDLSLSATTKSISTVATAALMKKSLLAAFVVVLAALAVIKPWTASAATSDGTTELEQSEALASLEGPNSRSARVAVVTEMDAPEVNRRSIESPQSEPLETSVAANSADFALEAEEVTGQGSFVISGRALLLDGTPIAGQRVEAQSQVEGAADYGICTTDEDGVFEIAMGSKGPHGLTLKCRGDIEGSELSGIAAPTEGLELRVDALVLRAHLPKDIDLGLFEGAGRSMVAYGAEKLPFGSLNYAGFRPQSVDEICQELLPTGPGYFCYVGLNAQDAVELIAMLPPGAESGVYDIEFATESPELASLQVALTGAPVTAPSRVTVSLDWIHGGKEQDFPGALFFEEGRTSGRSSILLPGEYEVTMRVFSPPPRAWLVPNALTQRFTVEAGDEALIEVELVEGGGLEVVLSGADGIAREGVVLESWDPATSRWSRHLTYVMTPDGHFQTGDIDALDTPCWTWEPLPIGEIRVRVVAEGFRTVEETLHIKPAAFTKWSPRIEKLPEGSVR